jgi:hypothetical protein
MDESRKRTAGPDATRTPPQQMPPPRRITGSLPDRADARRRVEALDRHRRICRELEQLAFLVEYYCGPRRPAA